MEPKGLIPYLASLRLYREWMSLRLTGLDDAAAWNQLVGLMPVRDRRRMARTLVAGATGQGPLMLSVPVEGGASLLKRGNLGQWRISMHGRWQEMHLGAFGAAYSTMPFYQHLEPSLRAVIKAAGEGTPFLSLTRSLHESVLEMIDAERVIPVIRDRLALDSGAFRKYADENLRGLNTDLSILDVIFRKGPESIFALL